MSCLRAGSAPVVVDGLAGRVEGLRAFLRESAPLLVAFSGGVDSTLLLKLAVNEVGPHAVLAVTAHGEVHTAEELQRAHTEAARLGVRHLVVRTNELSIPGFASNPPERCYLCRSEMYRRLLELAEAEGLATVVDGANCDDAGDYRPGMQAAAALGVRSPLAEAGLSKVEVRRLAREAGLNNWDLPASACLATRFPYGEQITAAKLEAVAEGERFLRTLGFPVVRVRHHGDVARVEVPGSDIARATADPIRHTIVKRLRQLGYLYVALDLSGFRSGSLNEVLWSIPAGEDY